MKNLPVEVANQVVDALAAVLALLTDWGAYDSSPHRRAWMDAGRAAVMTRDEYAVREALAENIMSLDNLADSRDDERTMAVLEMAQNAMDAMRKAYTSTAKGRVA
jgi:hypothetical protein